MKRFAVTVVLSLIGFSAYSQSASYMEGGMMYARFHKEGKFTGGWMPGFSVSIGGLELSMYGGQFAHREFPDSTKLMANGGYWFIGYSWRSRPTERNKRFHYTLGGGVGGYGVREMNGFHGAVKPGIQFNLTKSISIAATMHVGYNFYGEISKDTTMPWANNGYLSTEKWFFNPNITLRLNTNPLLVKGDYYDKTAYWGGGMVTHESTSREGDYIVTRRSSTYLPAGEYVTDAIITSTNYVNLYPKMLVGTMKNYKGSSLAFGGGIAIRAGILALDFEYLRGTIGFHQSKVGAPTDQWKMKRSSVGIGLNWFNIPFPFRGPSLVRFIFGARVGKLTLDSTRPDVVSGQPNPEELFKHTFWSPFYALEFGTLGVHLEFFNQKQNGYASGLVLGATYLLPVNPRIKR